LDAGVQGIEQRAGRGGHIANGGIERLLIHAGGGVEPADLPNELERRVMQLLIARSVSRDPEPLNVSAHVSSTSQGIRWGIALAR
jgi:hypothetical protein